MRLLAGPCPLHPITFLTLLYWDYKSDKHPSTATLNMPLAAQGRCQSEEPKSFWWIGDQCCSVHVQHELGLEATEVQLQIFDTLDEYLFL